MSVHEFRQRMKDPARSKRTGREVGDKSSSFRIASEPEANAPRKPTVSVPTPEEWLSPEPIEYPDVIAAPDCNREHTDSSVKDVTSHAIAEMLLTALDAKHTVCLASGNKLWLWLGDIFAPMPDEWLDKAVKLYHGAQTIQAKRGETGAGMPWFFNPGNLAAVRKALFTDVLARQLGIGDPFATSPALAVFGDRTLVYDRRTRTARLEDNSPEWRATHAYPFAWSDEPVEPTWLLRVLREDTFAGVEEREREARILRIRQQMGLAMLGAQKLANLHSVLILKGAGHDGKSTLIELTQLCMPPDSWLPLNPQDLSSGTGDGAEGRARLHGKSAVFCDDVSERAMRDSSHYKTATAFGKLSGRHFGSGVNSFTVDVKATWFLACQELWKTEDKTRGFQRRHDIIEFPNTIDEAHADRALAQKLYSLERREIVVWACQAALELLRGGSLAKPECSARLMAAWMTSDGDIAAFIEANTKDCGDSPKSDWPTLESLWERYVEWTTYVHKTAGKHRSLIDFSRNVRKVPGVRVERGSGEKSNRSVISRSY